jgi:hypothetical protein
MGDAVRAQRLPSQDVRLAGKNNMQCKDKFRNLCLTIIQVSLGGWGTIHTRQPRWQGLGTAVLLGAAPKAFRGAGGVGAVDAREVGRAIDAAPTLTPRRFGGFIMPCHLIRLSASY